MNRLILIFILTFSFQALIKADDIKDFEIEGISIGDSALDYFSKKRLDEQSYAFSDNDKYLTSFFYRSEFQNYDAVEVSYLKNDKNYIIKGISGGNTVTSLEDCKKKYNKIKKDLNNYFNDADSVDDDGLHPSDTTGKSKYFRTSYSINPKSNYFEIETSCIFYEGEASKKFTSNAGVTIKDADMNDWLNNEAYN
ncbi:hypothetical protein OAV64_01865 [Candidatus Pelagibacter sp.]|nr:hypothetical protein [Candidatus Pelagibacter sp.]